MSYIDTLAEQSNKSMDTQTDVIDNYPRIINSTKESKARPMCKRKPVKASLSNAPLMKIKSARSVEQQRALAQSHTPLVVETLKSYRNCRVLLVDCWKGKPLPSYLDPLVEKSHHEEHFTSSKKVKKKKKKDSKVGVAIVSICYLVYFVSLHYCVLVLLPGVFS